VKKHPHHAPSAPSRWHPTGAKLLAAMRHAIVAAKESVRLEMYIIQDSPLARHFRDALVAAAQRGVRVRVLADAWGSSSLSNDFYESLIKAGGEFRFFNPLTPWRMGLRDHRKLLVCDERAAFIGGVNLAPEYDGDGRRDGWRDLGLEVDGALAAELARAFDEMFARADFRHRPFAWMGRSSRQRALTVGSASLLLSAPGWQRNPLIRTLEADFAAAKKIQIMTAYFLPNRRLRHFLRRAAKRGAQVQLLLAGKSDVPIVQLAARGLYRHLLREGVEIYEYQPQILHAKLIVVDERIVYVGSANLDVRSLYLNYELLVRLDDPTLANAGARLFAEDLTHCEQLGHEAWIKSRHWWERLKSRVAYVLLTELDPFLAAYQVKSLRLP
jgi:cardiolipin synthase